MKVADLRKSYNVWYLVVGGFAANNQIPNIGSTAKHTLSVVRPFDTRSGLG